MHKQEGREIKVGYKKLSIDGKWWYWDEYNEKLVDTKNQWREKRIKR